MSRQFPDGKSSKHRRKPSNLIESTDLHRQLKFFADESEKNSSDEFATKLLVIGSLLPECKQCDAKILILSTALKVLIRHVGMIAMLGSEIKLKVSLQ